MYTQCPECDVAFRVTAEVLRQAAGKVRCGGCGAAFNALNHLSEHEPAAPAPPKPEPERQLPELTPDPPGDLEADTPPKSISAEQSAALLKTLDELAGSDIRIEDTGVEWRVLDDDEAGEPAETAPDEESPADEPAVEAMLEGSFKPIDEVITESADSVEGPEVIEEMRFDDDTPLPEDFYFDSVAPAAAAAPVVAQPEPPPPDPAGAQVDLAFGDPNEWQELLGDLDEPAETVAGEFEQAELIEESPDVAISPKPDSPEASEALAKAVADAEAGLNAADEAADIDEAAFEQPPDMDTQFAIQAEAMGIDLSGLHATKADEEAVEDDAETSIEEDLIAAAFESEATARNRAIGEHVLEPEEIAELEALEQEALEAAKGPEKAAESDGPEETPAIAEHEESFELEETPAAAEDEESTELELAPAAAEVEESIEPEEVPVTAEDEASIELEFDEEIEPEDEPERKGDVDEIARSFDDKVEQTIETMSASFGDGTAGFEAGDASDEHVVPEMSEEEKTINMMIDEELLNIAVEDEDGFASTIVQLQPNKDVEKEIDDIKETKQRKKKEKRFDRPPLVETIIMEGESIRAELDDDREQRQPDRPAISIPLPTTPDDYSRRGEIRTARTGMIAGAVALVLLLALQALHQSREALATVPVFNKAVGPVYRMLGKPLTPTWDISGWRFEATKGSTDEEEELLTIYSRIGNESNKDLPYPLVHVSLTDRFEEIIGSRVLEPGEYLPENADPRKLVPAGNTFNAVISIASPDAAATGFKLNVCYRLANRRLRCAVEDFK